MTSLHRLALLGTDLLIAGGMAGTVWLLFEAPQAAASLSPIVMLLATHRSQIVRHLYPAPEYEADPAHQKKEREP
ncbi:hypothetical protein [Thermaurantiacus tibetensis]|uniref:hypothetical protein n=1 Tax=Thermaurantiacus tibetensis TaxID=2759035 RepID=UPI00188F97FB|nr:hypothetical protein [Thermaurantiacus tibetensis]